MKDYKRILQGVVNIINITKKSDIGFANICAYIDEKCPELKESEGERIWIINYLNNRILNSTIIAEKENLKKAIAWLEKQCESYTKRDVDDAYLEGVTNTKNEIEKQYEANYQIRKDIATFIFNYRGDIKDRTKWMDYLGIKVSFVENQSEQKLADKVEPKFKVGECVVRELDNTCYQIKKCILNVTNNKYGYDLTSGGYISSQDANFYHLWTIEDAKDGDVLAYNDGHGNDCIELIKSVKDKKIEFWFCLSNGNRYEVFDGIVPYTNFASRKNATPATKEQRDLFFQKMHEAGYEWDAEHKQMKKIAQKSTPMSLDEAIEHCKEKSCGNSACALEHKQLEKWLTELKALKEQNPWSEEDEQYLLVCKNALAKYQTTDKWDACIISRWLEDKLKSLKDRVQPKQEWSEEDEALYYGVIETEQYMLDVVNGIKTFAVGNESIKTECQKELDWLKSLKERIIWEPSEKQIDILDEYIYIAHPSEKYAKVLISLLDDLKKLKD